MSDWQQDAETLRQLGVPFLAGVPGSGPSYELLDACERAGVPFVSTAHESAGAIMAGTAARQTGTCGAALSIKGPGVANLIGGIALARFENYPLLTFSEAFGASSPRGLQHKRMAQDDCVAPLAKAILHRSSAGLVGTMAALATAEPAGPVHMNLADGPAVSDLVRPTRPSSPLEPVLERIRAARRPIVICGSVLTRLGGAPRSAVLPPQDVPVFTTAAAKGVVDENAPCAAGVFTGAGGAVSPERAIVPECDLVIGLGLRSAEVLAARPFPAPFISLDVVDVSHQVGFEPAVHWTGDLLGAIGALAQSIDVSWGLDLVASTRDRLAAHLDRGELLPAAVYRRLASVPDACLVTDSGNFTVVAEHVWRAAAPDRFVGSSNGRFMGAGLPQAIGAALASPRRPTLCTIGDGGLPPFVAEIRLAVDRKLPLLIVLASDGYYGSMRARVTDRGLTETGIRITGASWEHAIAALGCPAVRVTTIAAFDSAVSGWQPAGPLFIEAAMPDRPYVDLVRDIRG